MRTAKEILGLGFFLLSTMIDAHELALFLRNKRLKMGIARMIEVLEEQMWVEDGLNKSIIKGKEEEKSY